jgi:sugar lactone lactonase YvrE
MDCLCSFFTRNITPRIVSLILLILVYLFIIPVWAEAPPEFVQSLGNEDVQVNRPHGIALDSKGNVNVPDGINHRILTFDSNGVFLGYWGTYRLGNGDSWLPNRTAVDSSGNIFIVDTAHDLILKFDSNGTFLTRWSIPVVTVGEGQQFAFPVGIAVDSSGNIYVVDYGSAYIFKYDSNLRLMAQVGGQGLNNGQLSSPNDIAVDTSGNIYVADSGNHRIQKLDSNGTFVAKWGTFGTGDGQLISPGGIAVDNSGNIYIADTENHRIQKLDSNGTFVAKWGTYGTGGGQFNLPNGIAVDNSGNIYVADTENHRIQKFTYLPYGAPTSLSATTVSASQINLSWIDKSNNESDFLIERCQGAGCMDFVQIATVTENSTNYSDMALTSTTEYTYRVRAYNSYGHSAYSNSFTIITPEVPPAAPSVLSVRVLSKSQLRLDWNDNSTNEIQFKIERCRGAGCTDFSQIAARHAGAVTFTKAMSSLIIDLY